MSSAFFHRSRLLAFFAACWLLTGSPNSLLAQAQQLTTPDKLLSDITRGNLVKKGCRITAQLTVDSLKKIGTGACIVPEPTGTTKLACAVGLALQDKKLSAVAITGITSGCNWTVKKVSAKTVEVTIEVAETAKESVKEVQAWFGFLNTFEGAIWFMNQLAR